MSSFSEPLQMIKEFVTKNPLPLDNKYVCYATGAISSLLTVVVVQKVYMKVYRKRNKLPNGADGYPFIGCLPQFASDLKTLLHKFPKYGPLAHYVVLGQDVIMVNDYKLAKVLLGDERLLLRPSITERFPDMLPMTAFTNGKVWADGRKLTYNALARMANKSFIEKMLKITLEEYTFKSIDEVIDNNQIWMPADDCRHIAFNTIYSAVSGKSMGKNDKNFSMLNTYLSKWLQSISLVFATPAFLQAKVAATTVSYQNNVLEFINPLVQECIDTYDENILETWVQNALSELTMKNNSNGVVNEKNNSKLNITEQDLRQLKGEILVMFAAGIDTTGYSLEYAVLVLANYPKYQELVYEELSKKYPNKESFSLAKMNECPLLRAFVSEVLRSGVPGPQGGMRTTFSDYPIEITKDKITDEYKSFIGEKYVVPKNCLIQINHYHYSKTVLEEFNIYNWLKFDKVNNVYKYESNNPNFFPFSIGKRACPGESIALTELHYSISQLILNYKFKPINNERVAINTICDTSMTVYPKSGIKVERR